MIDFANSIQLSIMQLIQLDRFMDNLSEENMTINEEHLKIYLCLTVRKKEKSVEKLENY